MAQMFERDSAAFTENYDPNAEPGATADAAPAADAPGAPAAPAAEGEDQPA
jgi:large subunit ribosomal protein L9